MPIITLTTDYGLRDYYVGAVKGVILSICPDALLVDVSHDIGPQRVADGAFVLRHAFPCFPAGTIHVAVVDPGVGTARRVLVARYAGQYVVAPDNGLVTWLHRDFPAEAVHAVSDSRFAPGRVSATFHGRDIMGPIAAHLGNGVGPEVFGPPVEQVETLPILPRAEERNGRLHGEIIYVDRFGNLVTNVAADQLQGTAGVEASSHTGRATARVFIGGLHVGGIRGTFDDAAVGDAVVYVGSAGFLEVAVNHGSALERFGLGEVIVQPAGDEPVPAFIP